MSNSPESASQTSRTVTATSEKAASPTVTVPAGKITPAKPKHATRKRLIILLAFLGVVSPLTWWAWPSIVIAFNTVSTDDAYVNGHVTYLAPRVSGQVVKVYVDDNDRVRRGDIIVQLDPEPYQVAVDIQKAAVSAAQADLTAATAQVHALVATVRANRYVLENAIQQVDQKIATLRSSIATHASQVAALDLARANLRRAERLSENKVITQEELDTARQTVAVDEANVDQALQMIYANRVSLGLPAQPADGANLNDVPADLDQSYSTVRVALAQLIQSGAQIGYFVKTWDITPHKMVEEFIQQDPQGNLDHIYSRLMPNAPQIKQAESRLLQAQRDLEQAELNLKYCNVVSDIDGVVTRRNVNPGNNVQAGQSLMAVRSLTEIWIDANFKETQLADIRIGQRVECDVDMYGSKQKFEGRVTGFTMGTGQTLSLLPPQNATGNFVKIVQRLPVRIELTDYDPEKLPLFVGLSVTPHVFYKEPAGGANAGEYLRPTIPLLQGPTELTVSEPVLSQPETSGGQQ